ncbi:hypothetical protein QWZ08_01255 [Ferruginibacter paludis]|uniref:DUF6629 family protein n=1 Tax=Ferruginibacter paludis TaxID=1310417 RepID=UPI0025B2E60E|nr:DUF6629 family protein [Ferruginibacter paludis]MDN3654230.1 hypothetical protein [Ferruginibacter paludis]
MCFSANASFTAGVVLTAIGIATIKKVQHPRQLLFASIPFLFGIQQIIEGFLWITLPRPGSIIIQTALTHLFLFFAQVVWPVMAPVSVLMLEKRGAGGRGLLKMLVATGVCVSSFLAWCLLFNHVSAQIDGAHISYRQNYPDALGDVGGILYVIATVAPSFFSHQKKMWLLGSSILFSYMISQVFYTHYIISVWCFFAAVISVSVYFITDQVKRTAIANSVNRSILITPS